MSTWIDDYYADVDAMRLEAFVERHSDDAAVVFGNDPVGGQPMIHDLAGRGYIVRTMADSSTVEARSGDRTRMNAAFASGAHIVSTDYYRPDPRGAMPGSGWSNYAVALPGGGPARANPVSAGGGAPTLRICE